MSEKYSKEAFKTASIATKADIQKVLQYLSGRDEAAAYITKVRDLLSGGGYELSVSENEIIGSKYFNVREFEGLFDDQGRKKEESRLKRIKDYYRWLKEYERVNKKRDEKDDTKKGKNKTETETLKTLKKVKKESDSKIIKTAKQAGKDFLISQDAHFKKTVYDFQIRWDNNDEKVGNVFSQNYQQLKQDFEKHLLQAGGPYLKKAQYYRNFVSRYGLEEIASSTLECLIKRTPFSEVASVVNDIQQNLNNFKRDADTVITESLNITDQLIGIAEEVKDTYNSTSERTKKIKNQYKDYKNKLKPKKVPTAKDINRSKVLQQFAKVLLPIVTTKVASVISTIIQNACNENETATFAIPSVIDQASFRNSLKNTYGYDADTSDDYLAMLQDISGFLTPVEICELFNGEASDQIVNSIYYFISVYYRKIFLQLSTKPKLAGFFVFIGQLVDPSFCKEIEFSALGDDFCFEPDSYENQLRECLVEENPDLLGRLRKNYIETKKQQLRDVLEFSFYPFELKGEQEALNKIFQREEDRRREQPLMELAGEYESQYNQSLLNLPVTFIKEQQRTEVSETFLENTFAGAFDDMSKEERDRIKNQVPTRVTKLERHILPAFNKSIFLRDDETKFVKNSYVFEKYYWLLPISARNMIGVLDSLYELQKNQSGVNQMNMDLDHIYYNPAFQIPDYFDSNRLSFETKEGKYKCKQDLQQNSLYLYPGDRDMSATNILQGRAFFPEVSSQTEFLAREKSYAFNHENSRKKDALLSYRTFVDKAGFSGTPDNKAGYNLGFKDTYNKLANICANSVFAKKIPVGLASGPSDNGNISGLEIVKIGQELDPACAENLIDNFGMISFKRIAKQAAKTDITDFVISSLEAEEDELREKYFNNVMSFKTHVLDFITKSIFLFSEFNLERDEVDDSMIDYIYVEYFRNLVDRDTKIDQANIEFESLIDDEKKSFIDNTHSYQDVSALIAKYTTELGKMPGLIAGQKTEAKTSKQAFTNARETIENYFVFRLLDSNIDGFITKQLGGDAGLFGLEELIRNIKASTAYTSTLYVYSARYIYDEFVARLTRLKQDARQIALDLGYLIFDMDKGQLKDILNDSLYVKIKDNISGNIDDQVDELFKKAKAWNTDWQAWHDKNVGPDPDKVFTKSKTFELDDRNINYTTNLWDGGHVVKGVTNVDLAFIDSVKKLEKDRSKEFKIYAKEIKEFTFASQQSIALGNKKIILENLIDELTSFQQQQDNIKYNITYDTARSLLHFYNDNFPSKKTEEFCEAIRSLIRQDISDYSKTLKEIIYTPQMRGERIFDIKGRMVEKQLNIFHSDNSDFKDDLPDQLGNILNNTIGGDFTYFNTAREDDDYIDKFLPSVIKSQIGQTHFHMTKVKFDPSKDDSASVDVYLVRDPDSAQLAKAGFPMKNLGDIGRQNDELFVDIQEREYIKKVYTRYGISDKTANSRLGGPQSVNIADEVQKLFEAMDGVGTYESVIFNVLENNKSEDVVRIQKLFDAVYINVEGYGTLIESLKDELSGSELKRAEDALRSANNIVREAGGLKAGAFNFLQYPDFNNMADDPFSTKKTFGERVGEAFGTKAPIRNDKLYREGFRWVANAKYPASTLSQYFGRTKWKVGDYKHQEYNKDKPSFWTSDRTSEHALLKDDYNNNPRIKGFLRGAAREIVPNYISLIDNFYRKRIYYKKTPILSFKVDASNYKDFVNNFKKANGNKAPTIQQYINHCLKHSIVKEARRLIFENDNYGNIYLNSFPLHKMISHIAINMNQYATFVNSANVGIGDNMLPIRTKSLKGMEDFAFFNQENLAGLGLTGLTTGLSLAGMDRIRVANSNLSVGDILQLTQSFDHSLYFIKSTIRYFLRNFEKADINIQVSKMQADSISSAIRKVYAATRLIVSSAEKIGKVFGADTPGKGIPSAGELDTQFKGMRYLFNLPVTPFAVANWFPGGLIPSNIQTWIAYVILESVLITIELLEDYGALEELEKLLFGDDLGNNPIGASGFNYITACKIAAEERLKLNPIVEKNQKTLGGEYLLPDGREYVGEYHIHKDGTAMVGGEHPKNQSTIVLTEVFQRDDIDV